jgi:hypothetical protein
MEIDIDISFVSHTGRGDTVTKVQSVSYGDAVSGEQPR